MNSFISNKFPSKAIIEIEDSLRMARGIDDNCKQFSSNLNVFMRGHLAIPSDIDPTWF